VAVEPADIFLNGPLGDMQVQLEQLPTDALVAPQRVVFGHLFDQGAHLGGQAGTTQLDGGFVLPHQLKQVAMPL
jgi:hypothetical protein